MRSTNMFLNIALQNSMKSGEDDTAYHKQLNAIYQEKFGNHFHYLACYYFLRDKLKYQSMMDDAQYDGEGMNKWSAGSKITHPVGNKKAKQLKRVKEIAEHIGTTLGIPVKKEKIENALKNNNGGQKVNVGDALHEIVNITHAGFSSWEKSIYFQHVDENLKQCLANAHICQEIMHLEGELEQVEEVKNKKNMIMHDEDDAIGAFMRLSESVNGDSALF